MNIPTVLKCDSLDSAICAVGMDFIRCVCRRCCHDSYASLIAFGVVLDGGSSSSSSSLLLLLVRQLMVRLASVERLVAVVVAPGSRD